uniref:Uncharacterized protein n=1 Tax=Arundo donax TaxID=35708 RepID=A0A0A8Z6G8_ARUDO
MDNRKRPSLEPGPAGVNYNCAEAELPDCFSPAGYFLGTECFGPGW